MSFFYHISALETLTGIRKAYCLCDFRFGLFVLYKISLILLFIWKKEFLLFFKSMSIPQSCFGRQIIFKDSYCLIKSLSKLQQSFQTILVKIIWEKYIFYSSPLPQIQCCFCWPQGQHHSLQFNIEHGEGGKIRELIPFLIYFVQDCLKNM